MTRSLLALTLALVACDETVAVVRLHARTDEAPASATIACGESALLEIVIGGLPSAASHWRVADVQPASLFTVSGPTEGRIDANATTTLQVRAAPSGPLAPGVIVQGVLVVEVDGAQRMLPLRFVPTGNYVRSTESVVDFGSAPFGAPRARTVTLENLGDVDTDVRIVGAVPPFTAAPTAHVPAHGTASIDVTYHPTSTEPSVHPITLIADGPACGPSSAIELRGEASGDVLSIDHGTLEFGATACGETAEARTVALTNQSPRAIAWHARLARGDTSPYALPTSAGVVLAGETVHVSVTAKKVVPTFFGELDDELILESDGGSPRQVSLHQRVGGAALAVTSDVSFPTTKLGDTSQTVNVSVVNRGATQSDVWIDADDFSTAHVTIPGGATVQVPTQFTPIDIGTRDAPAALASSEASCVPSSPTTSLRAHAFARAVASSISGAGAAFVLEGGQVAWSGLTGDAHLVDRSTHATAVARTYGTSPLVCATRQDASEGCWSPGFEYSGRPFAKFVGDMPRQIARAAWPYVLEPNGALDIVSDSLWTTSPESVRSLWSSGQTVATLVFSSGRVESWGFDIAKDAAGNYPVHRTAWPAALPAATSAVGSDKKGCALAADGTIRCVVASAGVTTLSNVAGIADGRLLAAPEPYAGSTCVLRSGGTVSCWGSALGGATPVDVGLSSVIDLGGMDGERYAARVADGRVFVIDNHQAHAAGWTVLLGGLD